MARSTFGGGIADFVVDASSGNLRLKPTTLTMWSAATGGTQYTDLLVGATAVTSIATDSSGGIPTFQGPDGVTDLYAQAPGGTARARLTAAGAVTVGEVATSDLQSTSSSTAGLVTGRRLWSAFAWLMAQFGYPYVMRYTSGAWPALSSAPAVITSGGYPLLWDSSSDSTAPTPPEARNGDFWDKLVA